MTVTGSNESVCRVLDERGQRVGNLKLIGSLWKFKAIGYDESGAVVPGGRPFTDQHNITFATPAAEAISAGLMRGKEDPRARRPCGRGSIVGNPADERLGECCGARVGVSTA
jgi:hypothetical protein